MIITYVLTPIAMGLGMWLGSAVNEADRNSPAAYVFGLCLILFGGALAIGHAI